MPVRPYLLAAAVVLAVASPAPAALADEPAAEPADAVLDPAGIAALEATARRAGLRVLTGEHLVLITDRPERPGDGVAELPAVFDAAWGTWCEHYAIDPAAHREWRACGCLIVDRERFRAAGLLPESVAEFTNGFCHRHRFWMADQSNPAYRRHLLLHEGVHAFTITLRSLDTPTWYTEGIAEYLATHRLAPPDATAMRRDGAGKFVPTPLPPRAEDVEQLGRIERIRGLRESGDCPALGDVFAARAANHRDLSAYATSWAAVTLLQQHPDHAAMFTAVERGPLDAAFTRRLAAAAGWDDRRVTRDFDAFTDELDYGFDFTRSRIDWSPGRPLDDAATVTVAADRGWQHSGLRLERGRRYAVSAAGRCTIGALPATPTTAAVTLQTEANGISLRWYRGRPLGRLLVACWDDAPVEGGRPRFRVLAEGATATFTAAADGPVYTKLNAAPGDLADHEGGIEVTFQPVP